MVKMSNTQFKEIFILLLMRVEEQDCVTDWRINPNPTLLASTSKYPVEKYGARS